MRFWMWNGLSLSNGRLSTMLKLNVSRTIDAGNRQVGGWLRQHRFQQTHMLDDSIYQR